MNNINYRVRRYRWLPAAYYYTVFSGGDDWGAGRRFGWRARERAIDKARDVVLQITHAVKTTEGAA